MWTLQRWSFDIKKSVITCFHSIIKTLLFETCGQHLNSYDLSELSSQVTTPRRTHNTLCWKQAWNLSSAWQLLFFRCSCSEDIGFGFSKTLRKKMQRNVTRKKNLSRCFKMTETVVMCETSDVLSFPTAALDIVGVDRLSGQLLCCTSVSIPPSTWST